MNASITLSNYKGRNTWKVLVSCTPSGLVKFVSDAWGGQISDWQLTEKPGLLDLLKRGMLIEALTYVQESVAPKGIW